MPCWQSRKNDLEVFADYSDLTTFFAFPVFRIYKPNNQFVDTCLV